MTITKDKLTQVLKSPAYRLLWKWSAGYHGALVLLGGGNILAAVLGLAMSLVMKSLIDSAVGGDYRAVCLYGGILGAISVLMLAINYGMRILNIRVVANLKRKIRGDMVRAILNKEYGALYEYHSGELVNRIFSDVNIVVSGLTDIIPQLLFLGVQLLGAAIILAKLDFLLVLILVGAGILVFIIMLLFRPKISSFHKKNQEMEGVLHASIQETLENVRLIKASGSEKRLEHQIEAHQETFVKTQMERAAFSAKAGTVMGIVFRGSWLYALLWGCMGIYHGKMTYGTLTATLQLVGQLQSPFSGLTNLMSSAYAAIASAERLQEILLLADEKSSDKESLDVNEAYSEFQSIIGSHLAFSYRPEVQVLHDLDFEICKGDFVAVTGVSGIGKSTLFQLLLGIYSCGEDQLWLQFRGHREQPDKHTRGLFAYVPQGNILFSGTLRENLLMFCEKASEEEIWNAADLACIGDFIRDLKDGLDSVIGERGIGLSEGQAQRIAVARALLGGAPILLLDESTSALDEETEARLLQNIANMKNKTCLIVTHRKAALKICNKTLHIKES